MKPKSEVTAELDPKDLLQILTAVDNGDFSKRLPEYYTGVSGKIAGTLNSIIQKNALLNNELKRLGKEVGEEGKVRQRVQFVPGMGDWTESYEAVNGLVDNLLLPLNEMTRVIESVSKGDLSQIVNFEIDGRELKGEFRRNAKLVNTMVEQLSTFTTEVTRVAREVGTDGKLGGQAKAKGLMGSWKELTYSVNSMASNLTAQVRNIADVTVAVANGDLSRKITVDVRGEFLQLKDTINTMVEQLRSFASEVTRVAREVGVDGKLGGQAMVQGVAGTWKDLTDNVNMMANNLTSQVRNIATVTTAVANGDLTRKITVDARGEILELKDTINTMVDQLNSFASEVTRVAREVGTEGKLGGQVTVKGVGGTWKDLTDSVNLMANNLTDQVRGIVRVVTAVAMGDLNKKLFVQAKGEIASLSETINSMIDTLSLFADQVTSVAREVGVEGKLGGQAYVPGSAGIWKDLTDNVNQLAANLTTQVRAIAEVSVAVTKGDLSRSVKVDARGEVEELKNSVNEMIRNLKETTQTNTEQDWLKTNLAKFTRMLQGQRDIITVSRTLLSELALLVRSHHGCFYLMETFENEPRLRMLSSYGLKERKNLSKIYKIGDGLIGQCAYEKQRILLSNVPNDYIQISSGLGEARPLNIIIIPVLFEGNVKAVIELASFEYFSPINQTFLEQLTESIGIVLNTIEAGSRTEELLKQSQSLAKELQSQQQELQQTNDELERKAKELLEQNAEVERKNSEIDVARQAIEEKAEQLALTSKYKSEFLSNMSHELRTPLNSLLILSQQLAENPEHNLTHKQVNFAKTIHSSGNELLTLINDILDLSKIESGTVSLDLADVSFDEIRNDTERTFRHMADTKGLKFQINLDRRLPGSIYIDEKRLRQVLKNLLSNSFKFTEKGEVILTIAPATSGWSADKIFLNRAEVVIAFTVSDTGIGIPKDKQKIIFEAFQQADGSTSRKYGGTGLGLAICRETAALLGGEVTVQSEFGKGASFTLFLPLNYAQVEKLKSVSNSRINAQRVSSSMKKSLLEAPYNQDDLRIYQKSDRKIAKLIVVEDSPLEAYQTLEIISNADGESRVTTKMAEEKQEMHQNLHQDDVSLTGKKILVVDDDIRNIFAITSMLEGYYLDVLSAENGKHAIEILQKNPEVHAVLMDIMMPEMDGYETIREIRKNIELKNLPIIALTAKAMKGDREKCIEAGASDYISKPVNMSQLISMLRVWLDK